MLVAQLILQNCPIFLCWFGDPLWGCPPAKPGWPGIVMLLILPIVFRFYSNSNLASGHLPPGPITSLVMFCILCVHFSILSNIVLQYKVWTTKTPGHNIIFLLGYFCLAGATRLAKMCLVSCETSPLSIVANFNSCYLTYYFGRE